MLVVNNGGSPFQEPPSKLIMKNPQALRKVYVRMVKNNEGYRISLLSGSSKNVVISHDTSL